MMHLAGFVVAAVVLWCMCQSPVALAYMEVASMIVAMIALAGFMVFIVVGKHIF